MHDIAASFSDIRQKIDKACAACGREKDSVHLVAVSKLQPEERVRAALDAGHRLFGENRVQEAKTRWKDLRGPYPDLRLHMIGHLQTNKAKDAVALFDCIETVDSESLARALAQEMDRQGRRLPCLIQVNTGAETQKSGVLPENVPEFLAQYRALGLDIRGLMVIPPLDGPPALHFALLGKIANELSLTELSMGMSADFEKAIPLGATFVRVGTALFGKEIKAVS